MSKVEIKSVENGPKVIFVDDKPFTANVAVEKRGP
jgi:hypothetical protein